MMKMTLCAVVCIALASVSRDAVADQVSYVGADTFDAGGNITFYSSVQAGTASGIFAGFLGTTAIFHDFNFETYSSGHPVALITDENGAELLTYVLSTDSYAYSLFPDPSPGSGDQLELAVTGTGTFYIDSVAVAIGSFNLTTQGSAGAQGIVTFSESSYAAPTTLPTPEPNSLLLLGSGLASAAGFLMRRRRLL